MSKTSKFDDASSAWRYSKVPRTIPALMSRTAETMRSWSYRKNHQPSGKLTFGVIKAPSTIDCRTSWPDIETPPMVAGVISIADLGRLYGVLLAGYGDRLKGPGYCFPSFERLAEIQEWLQVALYSNHVPKPSGYNMRLQAEALDGLISAAIEEATLHPGRSRVFILESHLNDNPSRSPLHEALRKMYA